MPFKNFFKSSKETPAEAENETNSDNKEELRETPLEGIKEENDTNLKNNEENNEEADPREDINEETDNDKEKVITGNKEGWYKNTNQLTTSEQYWNGSEWTKSRDIKSYTDKTIVIVLAIVLGLLFICALFASIDKKDPYYHDSPRIIHGKQYHPGYNLDDNYDNKKDDYNNYKNKSDDERFNKEWKQDNSYNKHPENQLNNDNTSPEENNDMHDDTSDYYYVP